jgi:hypothetical protein
MKIEVKRREELMLQIWDLREGKRMEDESWFVVS